MPTNGLLPKFTLIRSLRRTLSVQINQEGELTVKAPYFLPTILINRFVYERMGWINKHLAKFKNTPIRRKKDYTDGEKFMYQGKIYPLHIGDYKKISITDKFNFPEFLTFRIRKEIKDWYLREAKTVITQRVDYWRDTMNTRYAHIRFSDTSSKWGSCSVNNHLQFNWRLIMAPLLVIDYVVVHELAHTVEKNHSRKFWNTVGFYKPAYRQYRKWLRENSHYLHI